MSLGPIVANDGRPVYTALIKPMPSGAVLLCVLVIEDQLNEDSAWATLMLEGEPARQLTAAIAMTRHSGGTQ